LSAIAPATDRRRLRGPCDLAQAWSSADIKLFIRQLKALDEGYRGDFGVRLGHVAIDTIAATFGMKDANAEATKVCNILRSIGNEVGALMAPVHHYGKNPESGLRGASA
jgi:hypothetical protein